ncbi:MAG: hypothetical protein JWQ66_4183 [Mucilaginibacter sp.]|nr:hypothetical protein [Mucilaginibacter sp.]
MLKQLPFKKEYLLAGAAVILLLVSYQMAFKKTIEAWQLNYSLKRQLAQSTDVSYQPQYQERKNANLGKIIDLYKVDTMEFRNNIIGNISVIAEKENVKLTEVPTSDPHYHSTQFIIQKLNFEGDYFSLIKVLNQLEKANGMGVMHSATIKTTKPISEDKKEKKLVLEIYVIIINK